MLLLSDGDLFYRPRNLGGRCCAVTFSRQNCAGDVARLIFCGKIGRVKNSATKTRNRVKTQKNQCFGPLRAKTIINRRPVHAKGARVWHGPGLPVFWPTKDRNVPFGALTAETCVSAPSESTVVYFWNFFIPHNIFRILNKKIILPPSKKGCRKFF